MTNQEKFNIVRNFIKKNGEKLCNGIYFYLFQSENAELMYCLEDKVVKSESIEIFATYEIGPEPEKFFPESQGLIESLKELLEPERKLLECIKGITID